MSALLLDTHVWAWSFYRVKSLSKAATIAIESADVIHVCAVSFYEIAQKHSLGKWPEMEAHHTRLIDIAAQQGVQFAPLTPGIASHAAARDWAHRDPFDRIIASTAEVQNLTLITKDRVFDTLPDLRRVW